MEASCEGVTPDLTVLTPPLLPILLEDQLQSWYHAFLIHWVDSNDGFSTQGDFFAPRDIWQYLETSLVVEANGCNWHLVERGQGC